MPKGRIAGVVRSWDDEQGWGVIDTPETPGGCFVHFSNIAGSGYRTLHSGEPVLLTYEQPGFKQDGYDFRALTVWPDR
ncbi:cold shock domain-containing protein [Acidimicrobiaceae bacterium USS-CC1]|uniref:Cold shock domain-containing protein n=1 Tax=Acidiferrimicrobium australe TaxID=2664430 RepID=A0ABW9QWQ2_9ACTN|nr:cold shock domain-containing protein [Acidiferrimicrobium australe]